MYEQSSEEIWQAVCAASKVACGDDGGRVKGIGFDATCSLVVLGSDNEPLSVSLTGSSSPPCSYDIICTRYLYW